MKNQELAKIVKQVQSDKEKHFEKLFNEIYKTIYYLSFKFLNNEEGAKDVSQEIILCIYSQIDELRVPEGFNNWMNRIIYTRCQNYLRKPFLQKEDNSIGVYDLDLNEEQMLKGDQWDPEEVLQTREKKQFILEIINALPIKQKEVILLYYYQQLTALEIADVLSCSLPAIQNRLYTAKKSIRERVEKSKQYTVQQLFGVGAMPILFKLLMREANLIATDQIRRKLWTSAKLLNYGLRYKSTKVRLSFFVWIMVGILLFGIAGIIRLSFEESKQNDVSVISKQFRKARAKGQSLVGGLAEIAQKVEEIIIHIDNGIVRGILIHEDENNIEVQESESFLKDVEEQSEHIEEAWNVKLFDISPSAQRVIWAQGVEREFANKAILVENDMENLTYDDVAGDRNENEFVFEEHLQIKASETVYHLAITPQIAFEKSSDLSGNTILYYIHLENIGEVVAYNIIVKDTVPQYTELIQITVPEFKRNRDIIVNYEEELETIFWEISKLDVAEKLTLAFQVKVKEYKDNYEISNIAYISVIGDVTGISPSEKQQDYSYIESNEVLYKMQLQKEIFPKTSDGIGEYKQNILLIAISSILLLGIFYLKRNRI